MGWQRSLEMPRKRFSAEQIVVLFRQIEVLMSQGKAAPVACREAGISQQLRDECLNQEIFYSLKDAEVVVEQWRNEYDTIRPHSSPGYRPPAPQTSTGYQPNLVIWNASSPHIEERSELRKESAYGESRCERPADRAVDFDCARTGVFGEASSSSPCSPVAI
jgi:putative transposase